MYSAQAASDIPPATSHNTGCANAVQREAHPVAEFLVPSSGTTSLRSATKIELPKPPPKNSGDTVRRR